MYELSQGGMKFSATLLGEPTADINMKWDIGGPSNPTLASKGEKDRNFDLRANIGKTKVELRGDFELDYDSMDGVFQWRSNLAGHETATLRLEYDIAVESRLNMVLVKNGQSQQILVTMVFDNLIPTIKITTPFEGTQSQQEYSSKYSIRPEQRNLSS